MGSKRRTKSVEQDFNLDEACLLIKGGEMDAKNRIGEESQKRSETENNTASVSQ